MRAVAQRSAWAASIKRRRVRMIIASLRAEVLLGAVVDRAHALGDGLVLHADAGDAGVARRPCCAAARGRSGSRCALLALEAEAAVPVGGVRAASVSADAWPRSRRASAPLVDVMLKNIVCSSSIGTQARHTHLEAEHAGRDHRVEGEQELRDAPVVAVRPRPDGRRRTCVPNVRVDDLVARRAVFSA